MLIKKIDSFDGLNNKFKKDFYGVLYNYLICWDLKEFYSMIILMSDIKNDMIESCKESRLLYFKEYYQSLISDILVKLFMLIR
jgi:hypothetical protein